MTNRSDPAVDRTRWVRWRADRLLAAGFSAELAEQLARDAEMDVHALLELVDRGCPPHLAARIVASLDDCARSEPHSRD
jgi:hypothetical protein